MKKIINIFIFSTLNNLAINLGNTDCTKYSNKSCHSLPLSELKDISECVACKKQYESGLANSNINIEEFYNNYIFSYFSGSEVFNSIGINLNQKTQKTSKQLLSNLSESNEDSIINCQNFTNLKFLILPSNLKATLAEHCSTSITEKNNLNYLIPYLYFNDKNYKTNIDKLFIEYVGNKSNNVAEIINDLFFVYGSTEYEEFYEAIQPVKCNNNTNYTQPVGITINGVQNFDALSINFQNAFQTFLSRFSNFDTLNKKYNYGNKCTYDYDCNNDEVCTNNNLCIHKICNSNDFQKNAMQNIIFGTPTAQGGSITSENIKIVDYLNGDKNIQKYCYPNAIKVFIHGGYSYKSKTLIYNLPSYKSFTPDKKVCSQSGVYQLTKKIRDKDLSYYNYNGNSGNTGTIIYNNHTTIPLTYNTDFQGQGGAGNILVPGQSLTQQNNNNIMKSFNFQIYSPYLNYNWDTINWPLGNWHKYGNSNNNITVDITEIYHS